METLYQIIIAYLVGSVPFGIIVQNAYGLKNLREHGSGNIGATNMLRVGGKLPAALTFAGDFAKGLIIMLIIGSPYTYLAVVLGHIFPIYLLFKGGKGIATNMGALLGLAYPLGLSVIGVWFITYLAARISAIAGIVSTASAIIFSFIYLIPNDYKLAILAITLLIIYRHKSNITKMLNNSQ